MRLIDADALKERIRRFLSIRSLDNLLPEEKAIVQHIDKMPTEDAVPVVRCKDCIYPYICGVDIYCDHITGEEILVQPHGFCYWGERKDGERHE